MWFITQCFGVGFRGSHRAGDSVPLPGPICCNNVSHYTVHYMLVPPRFIGFYERHFPFSWYSWGVQWVGSGTWTAAWSRRDASWLTQGKGIYPLYTNSILVIWRLHSIYIPTLFLSYDDFIPSIYRLYSCHMTTSFHQYTDSILVIWRLHSIYIPTLFLS